MVFGPGPGRQPLPGLFRQPDGELIGAEDAPGDQGAVAMDLRESHEGDGGVVAALSDSMGSIKEDHVEW